jgi:hypothetical protein
MRTVSAPWSWISATAARSCLRAYASKGGRPMWRQATRLQVSITSKRPTNTRTTAGLKVSMAALHQACQEAQRQGRPPGGPLPRLATKSGLPTAHPRRPASSKYSPEARIGTRVTRRGAAKAGGSPLGAPWARGKGATAAKARADTQRNRVAKYRNPTGRAAGRRGPAWAPATGRQADAAALVASRKNATAHDRERSRARREHRWRVQHPLLHLFCIHRLGPLRARESTRRASAPQHQHQAPRHGPTSPSLAAEGPGPQAGCPWAPTCLAPRPGALGADPSAPIGSPLDSPTPAQPPSRANWRTRGFPALRTSA